MKPFCIYTIFGLGIIVGQTTILGLPVFHGISYDVLIPFVIFLGLDLPERQAGILILMIGFVMDVVSGGIFGLYMTVYLWTFFLIKGAVSYFDVKDLAFRSMVIAVCILAENLV
ncbi:MAG: rod shape-determining protein MreD, partial [Deltaproteobacteria bacterium]|nr:rod shape-determining protein MreD [Deltaproteobacteria bacterium]